MPVTVKWFGHASFRIASPSAAVYIDPWKIDGSPNDGDLVLISHSHYDHLSPDDLAKVSKPDAVVFGPADVAARVSNCRVMRPGDRAQAGPKLSVQAVPAYNVGKEFHPRSNNWLGWVVELDGRRVYYAGDTDLTREMGELERIDLALLPVGGTYTMDGETAAIAAQKFNPKLATPYHWGDIVGDQTDADRFAEMFGQTARILQPGEEIEL